MAQSDQPITLTALATAWDKAAAPEFLDFAAECGLPVVTVPAGLLQQQSAQSSAHAPARYGHRSLAESSALAAAGVGAQLQARRCVSPDGMATAAIAHFIPENTLP